MTAAVRTTFPSLCGSSLRPALYFLLAVALVCGAPLTPAWSQEPGSVFPHGADTPHGDPAPPATPKPYEEAGILLSIWAAYGHWILAGGLFTALQTVLIAALVFQARRSKRAERELRESEERFRALLDNIEAVSVQGYAPDGTVTYWNKASQSVYGYSSQEALGKNLVDIIIPPAMRGEVSQAVARMAETGQPVPASELTLMHKDGSPVPVFSSHAVVRTARGETTLFCIDVDIGPLRRTEQALRASEERLRLLVENAGDAIYLTDMSGHIMDVNPEAERQTGFTRQELLSMGMLDLDVDRSPENMAAFVRLISSLRRASYGTRFRRKTGGSFPVDLRVAYLESEGQGFLLGIARDDTARKRADELQHEANRMLAIILDSVPADVNVVDAATHEILFMNKAMKETFKRDCTGETCYRAFRGEEDVCGMCPIPTLFSPSGEPSDVSVWEDLNPVSGTWHLNHDRALRWIDGRMARIQIAMDISGRRASEERMAVSLREKDILLREIHHRVKNNLQIISSLLNLQEQGLEHPAALEALAESRGRVTSMAVIHEQLYRSSDFSEIDLADYLRQFLPRLISTYKGGRNITLALELSQITLTLDQAIPFGLIMNELVTNALKHGFRDMARGRLRIAATSEQDMAQIEVEDDGHGLPEGFDVRSAETLGLQLITSLAEQLSGTIEAGGGPGALFRLSFPLEAWLNGQSGSSG